MIHSGDDLFIFWRREKSNKRTSPNSDYVHNPRHVLRNRQMKISYLTIKFLWWLCDKFSTVSYSKQNVHIFSMISLKLLGLISEKLKFYVETYTFWINQSKTKQSQPQSLQKIQMKHWGKFGLRIEWILTFIFGAKEKKQISRRLFTKLKEIMYFSKSFLRIVNRIGLSWQKCPILLIGWMVFKKFYEWNHKGKLFNSEFA
jgi:hypothetical protein